MTFFSKQLTRNLQQIIQFRASIWLPPNTHTYRLFFLLKIACHSFAKQINSANFASFSSCAAAERRNIRTPTKLVNTKHKENRTNIVSACFKKAQITKNLINYCFCRCHQKTKPRLFFNLSRSKHPIPPIATHSNPKNHFIPL